MLKSNIVRILTALAVSLSFWFGTAATPAEAIEKTTHCGIYTSWRFVGSDDAPGLHMEGWWKYSSDGKSIAFCGKARITDMPYDRKVKILLADGRGQEARASGSYSTYKLLRVPKKGFFSMLIQANDGPVVAWVVKRV